MSRHGWLILLVAGCGTPAPPAEAPPRTVTVEPTPPQADPLRVAPFPRPTASCANKPWDNGSVTDDARRNDDPALPLFEQALVELGNDHVDEARKLLLELLETWKDSPLVPYGYLIFAELFMVETDSQPARIPVAVKFYRRVIEFDFPAKPFALLRLGEALEKADDDVGALEAYVRTGGALKHWDEPCRGAYQQRALAGFDRVYASVGDPSRRCALKTRAFADVHCN